MNVQTVTGAIPLSKLGKTLMHEHVIIRSPGLRDEYPDTFPRDEIIETSVSKLAALKECGISTIVDHTTYDLGRDVELVAEISERSRLNVVVATGMWITPPRYFVWRDADQAAEMFIKDINKGFGTTGVHPGVIKIAIDKDGLTPAIETMLRGAARAHLATGVPLSTHTDAETLSGLVQLDVFQDEGVNPRDVQVGHSGDTENIEYLKQLLASGCIIGMDRFGVEAGFLADDRRVAVVAELCKQGFAEQLTLSHDTNCWADHWTDEARSRYPNWHFQRIPNEIVPMLRNAGVTAQQIDTMLIDNPKRFFSSSKED